MTDNKKSEQFHLGFLATLELADQSWVGGLLVTNRLGRPLEFQCTSPVSANPTQRILYGPTLVPYILTDLLGRTLVEKVAVKPDLILTERGDVLDLRELISTPVACLDGLADQQETVAAEDQSSNNRGWTQEPENAPADSLRLTHGRQTLRFHSAHHTDRDLIQKKIGRIPKDADLGEPFERIREALEETTRSMRLREK